MPSTSNGWGPPPPEFEIRSDDGVVRLPFRLANNHLILQIEIDGTPLEVILDTGMPMNGLMLLTNDKVEGLDLPYGPGKARIGGAGGDGSHLEASIAPGVTVDVGAVRMKNTMVIVAPPLQHLRRVRRRRDRGVAVQQLRRGDRLRREPAHLT